MAAERSEVSAETPAEGAKGEEGMPAYHPDAFRRVAGLRDGELELTATWHPTEEDREALLRILGAPEEQEDGE